MGIARSMLLWGSQNRWIERQFRNRRFAKKAVSRFVPGEDADSALREARSLAEQGIASVLTHLGENISSLDQARGVTQHYLDVLERIQGMDIDVHISVKLTQLGLDIDRDATIANLEEIIESAARKGNVVWVDMEASLYVDVTLDIFRKMRASHDNVALCLQAYLHRTAEDLTDLKRRGASIRLVKGAYQEIAEIAMPKKRDVDAAFQKMAVELCRNVTKDTKVLPGIATHDIQLIAEIGRLAEEQDWAPRGYEVQMLFGIRRAEQLRLARSGVPVRVLISYGEAWFAWYMRRLAERPANVGFVLRTMFN